MSRLDKCSSSSTSLQLERCILSYSLVLQFIQELLKKDLKQSALWVLGVDQADSIGDQMKLGWELLLPDWTQPNQSWGPVAPYVFCTLDCNCSLLTSLLPGHHLNRLRTLPRSILWLPIWAMSPRVDSISWNRVGGITEDWLKRKLFLYLVLLPDWLLEHPKYNFKLLKDFFVILIYFLYFNKIQEIKINIKTSLI